MRVLVFGDVFGRPGRQAVKSAILKWTRQLEIDFIVINGENAVHGKGINQKVAEEFYQMGVDVITTGNHAWDQSESLSYFEQEPRLLRPYNYPSTSLFTPPGRGYGIYTSTNKPHLKLAVINLMGRVFMDPIDCPFHKGKALISELHAQGIHHILVDFHGEASSEKQAFSYFVDGSVSAVLGTHSHVQTADEKILEKGTAYLTDIGMSGCFDSVIGTKKEIAIRKFISKMPAKFEPAEGPGGYGAVMLDIDESTGRTIHIQRIREEVIQIGA